MIILLTDASLINVNRRIGAQQTQIQEGRKAPRTCGKSSGWICCLFRPSHEGIDLVADWLSSAALLGRVQQWNVTDRRREVSLLPPPAQCLFLLDLSSGSSSMPLTPGRSITWVGFSLCVCVHTRVLFKSTQGQSRFPAAHSVSLQCNSQRARHLVSCTSPVQSAGSGCQMSDGSVPKCYLWKGIGPDPICGVCDPECAPKAPAVVATRQNAAIKVNVQFYTERQAKKHEPW